MAIQIPVASMKMKLGPFPAWTLLLTPMPALTLGVLVMRTQGVPVRSWAQHGLLGLAALAGAGWLSRFLRGGVPKAWVVLAILVPFLMLGGTFLNEGVEGIHRWVRLGPVLIHSASLAAPLLLLVLGRPSGERGFLAALGLGGGVALALALQPDAAQTTAFSGAMLALWWRQRTPATWFGVLFLLGCVALAWSRPDGLAPVRHVEGIVMLAAKGGMPLLLVALATLAVLPLPFFLHGDPRARALGVYFTACLLTPLLGAFPVPVMGFGASPMLGYALGLAWLLSRPGRQCTVTVTEAVALP